MEGLHETRQLAVEVGLGLPVGHLPVAVGVEPPLLLEGGDLGEIEHVVDARLPVGELELAVVVDREVAQGVRLRPLRGHQNERGQG